MPKIKNYNDVEQRVDSSKGVATFEMWQLRDVHGVGRLGKHVATGISEELADRGLAHFPSTLPINQYERARVYRVKSAVGRAITASSTLTEEADNTLRTMADDDAQTVLQRVRELVCD